jgi:hypothetical protein
VGGGFYPQGREYLVDLVFEELGSPFVVGLLEDRFDFPEPRDAGRGGTGVGLIRLTSGKDRLDLRIFDFR